MSKSKSLLKPCCERFNQIALRYLDIVCHDDYTLRMIANLLVCAKEMDSLDLESVNELGHVIDEYINKKIAREHYFFGRTLRPCKLSAPDLGAEIHRVHAKFKESEELEA